jgi:hypothetical protein
MMDPDPRFPNRKNPKREEQYLGRKIDESESSSPSDTPADLELPNSGGEPTEDLPLPLSTYKIMDPAPVSPEVDLAEPDLRPTFGVSGVAPEKQAAAGAPTPPPATPNLWVQRIRKFAESPTRVYASIGVGLGILLGVVVASVLWRSNNPEGRYDLGSAASSAAGLQGHLFIEWNKKLAYRVTVEPSDASQQAGFALAVAQPPRPLAIQIHLQDSEGFVLCSRNILLKYTGRNAEPPAPSNPKVQAGKTNADAASNSRLAQGKDGSSEAQETERELDQDVFQNQLGPEGQIASIHAQGEIPCSAKAYEKTTSWSFSPDFPSLAEQQELLQRQKTQETDAARRSSESLAARRRIAAKAGAILLPFSVEGDDEIVEIDTAHGVIETRGKKTYFFDKTGGAGSNPRWQDYPVSIHYRCDRASNCVLTHEGLGALHAKLSR